MVQTRDAASAAGATNEKLAALLKAGQSIWLDFIDRPLLRSGKLQGLIDEGLRGMTSNPTIFEKAIASGNAYDEQVRELIGQGQDARAIFQAVAVRDIQGACDLFRPLYDSTGGADGFVSIEVSPALARDTQATIDEARALWRVVDRPNVMVKVPGTAEGWPAVKQLLSEGLNINVTLLFSRDSHEKVMWAYIEALEERVKAGQPVNRSASVASFFVSRVDTLLDKELEGKIAAAGNEEERTKLRQLLGQGAIANARLAYQRFQEIFQSDRFRALAAHGARVQRPLWASTGTKNPAYSDVLYVEELIGPDTVNTLPLPTLDAFKDHGQVRPTVTTGLDEARATLEGLAEAGIDLEAATKQLEDDGVNLFVKSFDSLIAGVEQKRQELRHER